MKKHSAGLVVFRQKNGRPEVLVAHMGAPWWAKKDAGAWSIPKGEIEDGEEPLETAKREFREELGLDPPRGEYQELGTIEQHNKKLVTAWMVKGDMDISQISGNTFEAEWPPHSGKKQKFPEIDRASWMAPEEAAKKTVRGQAEFFKKLTERLGYRFEADMSDSGSKQQTLL